MQNILDDCFVCLIPKVIFHGGYIIVRIVPMKVLVVFVREPFKNMECWYTPIHSLLVGLCCQWIKHQTPFISPQKVNTLDLKNDKTDSLFIPKCTTRTTVLKNVCILFCPYDLTYFHTKLYPTVISQLLQQLLTDLCSY